jgi:ADP-ribosyl-[dinitrogen reductase] hydrolase
MTQITKEPLDPRSLTRRQLHAILGALVGTAIGDALGAPFEFDEPGTYFRTFPTPVVSGTGELIGGGSFNWAPGEFTDDTQMALALAESLVDGKFDPETTWTHFKAWAETAHDIGNTTRVSLSNSDYITAAEEAHAYLGQSAGNGSVMRIVPIAIAGVRWGAPKTAKIARQQSDLTHYEEGASYGAAIVAELIRRIIISGSFDDSFVDILDIVSGPQHDIYADMLSDQWNPTLPGYAGNGSVWTCIAQAIWCVRNTSSFEEAVTTAVNLGHDADTVAAVTGAIAGALYGIQQIPSRWTTYVNGSVRQPDGTIKKYTIGTLLDTAHRLLGLPPKRETPLESVIKPTMLHDAGIFASNMTGAPSADSSMGVISLCRTYGRLEHLPYRREFYLIDKDARNTHLQSIVKDAVDSIEAFLREGREVLIHCHGGRSRTGLILKAWYMRHENVDHDAAHDWVEGIWPHYATWTEDFTHFLDDEWQN